MSTTLPFVGSLLARARTLYELGQHQDAHRLLKRLAGFTRLSPESAEEAQALLAEIQFKQHKYLRARRHLAVALGYAPGNAQYHYLMAAAVDADDRAEPERALAHYRRSLKLDPHQPACLVDYGLLSLELGRDRAGLKALRRAARLAPDDPEVLGAVVEGLCHLDRAGEARTLLVAARFRNPRDARFRRLWSDFQFQQVHTIQDTARRTRRTPQGKPVILPFLRSEELPADPATRKRVRRDKPAPPPKPHGPRKLRLYAPHSTSPAD